MKDEDFNHVLDVNLKSTFILNRNAIKKTIRRKYGRIINIASVVGVTGNPGQCNYVASKAGMIGFVKGVAKEVAPHGVVINALAPAVISTKPWEKWETTLLCSSRAALAGGLVGLVRTQCSRDATFEGAIVVDAFDDAARFAVLVVDGVPSTDRRVRGADFGSHIVDCAYGHQCGQSDAIKGHVTL